ncbi:GTP-binding protein [Mesorhizobium sp. WSM4976]|uniref:CobW family GTP-binding protein n=1 Tax=Mesorhizobium sp. WSM4976 TaxID=3038549 RepID=UPI002415BDF0|nr:GTP-binding protein [Mesorhizobium sp. WSM4976]MDG4892748.1 GTP-binding protein [Mesorhizobium sp. WSM4976]
MAEVPSFTPVHLVTGFLGSGKTTLLKRLLTDPALSDTAILINEFGEVGLDHYLVERIDENMVLLQSGCLCCTMRGELANAIRDLYSKRERGQVSPFQRLVIESTGLADPFPVLSTLKSDPMLRHHFKAGNVVTTVDVVNGAAELDRYIESNRQVAIADRLVLTKTDLAEGSDIARLSSRLRRINPDAAFLDAGAGFSATDLFEQDSTTRGSLLQSQSGFFCEEAAVLSTADGRTHQAAIASCVLTWEDEVDWTAFGLWLTMLINRHGERVLRIKGILNIAGEDRPVAIHGVQHLVHPPVHMEAWPSEDHRSRLVVIADGLDLETVERSFAAFALTSQRTVVRGSGRSEGRCLELR